VCQDPERIVRITAVAPAEVYRRSLIRPPRSPLRQSWAERYFPGEPAVGKQLYEGGDTTQAVTVIGVVGDVKYDGLQAVGDDVFVAVSQGAGGNALYAIVRTPTDPLALARPMQPVLQEIDPTLLPTEVATMQSLLADSLGGERHWGRSSLASHSPPCCSRHWASLVSSHATSPTAHARSASGRRWAPTTGTSSGWCCSAGSRALLGIAAGSVLAAFATRGLDALLFEVDRTDPATWLSACAVLLLVGLAACWLPARRAAKIDPLLALRQQ
jgi:putative ABC transport system permease protein